MEVSSLIEGCKMDKLRRKFLKFSSGLGAMSFAPLSLSSSKIEDKILNENTINKLTSTNWNSVRSLFTFSKQAPLNAANLCPAFDHVHAKLALYTERLNSDVSFINRKNFIENEVEASRTKVCSMLGIDDTSQLAFVRNTSEANATIVQGLQLEPDDEVLLWDQNHPTNYRSWHYQHKFSPFVCKYFTLNLQANDTDYFVDTFVKHLTPKTKVVSFSHLSNISGLRLPAKEIVQAIKKYNKNIFIHLDGAQSWGSIEVNIDEIGCDSFSSSGHKWFCGPRGTGILFVKEEWIEKIRPNILGYNFTFDYPDETFPADATRFESLGQRDDAAYGAIGDTVDLHQNIGIVQIERRIQNLTQYGLNGFSKIGISTITPKDPNYGHGAIIADMGGQIKTYGAFLALHNAGISSAFVHDNKIHCTPNGILSEDDKPVYLRICPHLYNNIEDLDHALSVVRRIKESNFEIIKETIKFM